MINFFKGNIFTNHQAILPLMIQMSDQIFRKGFQALEIKILGWPKSPCGFFCKIDTFFIFTNNFIDVDIFST